VRILFLLLAIGFYFNVEASKPLKWNAGVVVLADGSVLQGQLSLEKEVVLFTSGGEMTVFTAHKLKSFRYYDKEANINRKFISIQPSNTQTRHFYEFVVVGEVSVLRKFKSNMFNIHPQSDKYDFDYYIRFQNELYNISQFRKKIYPELVSKAGSSLLSLLTDKNLNANSNADAIQIAELFNKVNGSSPVLAGI
jgi:hypothetical protein